MKRHYVNIAWALWLILALAACAGKSHQRPAPDKSTGNPALDAINQKIEADPRNPQLYAERAALYHEMASYDNALLDLETAISMDSLQPSFYHLLTDVYISYFKSWQGLRVMNKAAELFPQDIPTLLKLAKTQLLLKMYAESLQTIDKILNIDPQNADAYMLMGIGFKESGDTARAINSLQKAVNANPELIDAWITLGQLHEAKGHAVAGKYYTSAVEMAPDNVLALHAKADYLSRFNDLPGALALYRQIVALDSTYKDAYFNSGLLYLDLDSIPQAYRQFDLAIRESPLHVRAYFYRGYSAERMGNKTQAVDDYKAVLRFAPDYQPAIEGLQRLGAPR